MIMIFAYFLGMKGVSTPPTFSAVDYLPLPLCLSMPLIYNVYYDSTHIHAKWLGGGGGGVLLFKKTFLVSIMFIKSGFFHPKLRSLV